jgi:PTS system nitrogen regulatory IIA component
VIPTDWLDPALVISGLSVSTVPELVGVVAGRLGDALGIERAGIEAAFMEAMRGEGFSIGRGVAVPHIEMQNLAQTKVCLVILSKPLAVATLDHQAPSIFLFILARPDPQAHLLLLAHVARLVQSRTLLEGLRRAHDVDEVVALVRAAEMRHKAGPASRAPAASHALIVAAISGEKAVDALLVDLVDLGLGDACIIDAQSLQEAAAREVPLFAGFRDLFGDPGGRRMLVLETPAEQSSDVLDAIRRVCEAYGARDARVSVLPVHTRWTFISAVPEEPSAGH